MSAGNIWADAPSPCIDICKYKRQGRCVGCTMTKAEKDGFPRSGDAARKRDFFRGLLERLANERNPAFWAGAYRRKCEKEGVACPLDAPDGANGPG